MTKETESILSNDNLSKEQKIQAINQYYENYRKILDEELRNNLIKQYLGAALQIGSAALPMRGIGNAGGKLGEKLLEKHIGRKISQNIGSGLYSGAASGSLFGLGQSLIDETNPIFSVLNDAIFGGLAGGSLGAAGSNIEKIIRGQQLKNYGDIDELSEIMRKKFYNDARKFYQDYIQKIQMDKNGIFEFVRQGIQEQLRWNPQQAKNLSELIKDIKSAKRLPDEPNFKPEQKPQASHYEVYRGKYGDHKIEISKRGERRYYFTKDTPDSTSRTTSPTSTESIETSFESPEYILNNLGEEFNSHMGGILYGGVEKNVNKNGQPTGYAASIDNTQVQQSDDQSDLFGYKNPLTGSSHIYAREEVSKMSVEKFEKDEKEIMAQLEVMKGKMPTNKDLQKQAEKGNGVIYVNSYTRSDGTHVNGYFRSLPAI